MPNLVQNLDLRTAERLLKNAERCEELSFVARQRSTVLREDQNKDPETSSG